MIFQDIRPAPTRSSPRTSGGVLLGTCIDAIRMRLDIMAEPDTSRGTPRHRVLRACEPCKQRKKRCDGMQPCATCVRYQYICFFSLQSRSRLNRALRQMPGSPRHATTALAPSFTTTLPEQHADGGSQRPARSRDATSRYAICYASSSRLIENTLQEPSSNAVPCKSSQPVQSTISTGHSVASDAPAIRPLTSALSLDRMQDLTANYINNFHPVYTFVRPAIVRERIAARYSAIRDDYQHESILFGIAALGSLYSNEPISGKQDWHDTLARSFQSFLEADIARTSTPNFELVASLVLKTFYLRSTSRSYATWITSCTTIETIMMMDRNMLDQGRGDRSQDWCFEPQQVLWIARLLNTWVANEFGRPPIRTPMDASVIPPAPSDPIFAAPDGQIVYLYHISDSLCPENEGNMEVFEDSIAKLAIIDARHCHGGVLLSRAVLAFCCHRLSRCKGNASLNKQTFNSLVKIGLDGLKAATSLAHKQLPWWHLGNAPFQFLCAMLMIDTSDSFAHVPMALEALQSVAQAMPTSSITGALQVARNLVDLCRQQKKEQLQHLDICVRPPDGNILPSQLGTSNFEAAQMPPQIGRAHV